MTDTPKDPQVAEYIDGMRAWRGELEALRPVLLEAGLEEQFKWRKPCYTHGASNIVIFQPFKGRTPSVSSRPGCQSPSALPRTMGATPRSSTYCSLRTCPARRDGSFGQSETCSNGACEIPMIAPSGD